jgi:septum formation protein
MEPLILASASPRRAELLGGLGISFRVVPSPFREDFDHRPPREQTEELARGKVQALLAQRPDLSGHMILGADTSIDIDGRILGKPTDRGGAEEQLRSLSGRQHEVITALALYGGDNGAIRTAAEVTRIWVAPLSEREIAWYLDTGEWQDAAGGYRIQGRGALFVQQIQGCYFNVMGLPLRLFYGMVTSAGWDLYRDIPAQSSASQA